MPPPPPQTPDHQEKSGEPLQQRPGQKAGDFIERDLWNLDEEWDKANEETEADKENAAPADHAEDPAGTVADEETDDTSETIDSTGDEEPESPIEEGPSSVLKTPVAEETKLKKKASSAGKGGKGGKAPAADPELELELDIEDRDTNGEESAEEPAQDADSDTEPDSDSADSSADKADEADSEWDPESESSAASDDVADPTDPPKKDLDDEFLDSGPKPDSTPKVDPKTKRLSTVELVSLAIVLVVFLAGAGWSLRTFFTDIPTRKSGVLAPDFPVRGELVSIENANSFWREPIRSGPDADTARRDAKLIPVLKLKIKDAKSDGALRVFFRDEEGESVGDPLTRVFRGGVFVATGNDQLQLAATAGFDDEGKHAAYQTEQTEPWTVQAYEGPREDASFEDFKLLFEMPVSAERR